MRCHFCFTRVWAPETGGVPLCAQCETQVDGYTQRARAEGAAQYQKSLAVCAYSQEHVARMLKERTAQEREACAETGCSRNCDCHESNGVCGACVKGRCGGAPPDAPKCATCGGTPNVRLKPCPDCAPKLMEGARAIASVSGVLVGGESPKCECAARSDITTICVCAPKPDARELALTEENTRLKDALRNLVAHVPVMEACLGGCQSFVDIHAPGCPMAAAQAALREK